MIKIAPHSSKFHAPTNLILDNKTDEPIQVDRITINGKLLYDSSPPVAAPPEFRYEPKGILVKSVRFVRDPSGKIVGGEVFEIPQA